MRAFLLITWNDLRQSFSDRTLLILMFAAPLSIATIITVTFGGLADESSPIDYLPVAVVNGDRGSPLADFGEAFEAILSEPETIFPGLESRVVEEEADALALLEQGSVAAVVILPADLSRTLTGPATRGPTTVRLVTRPDREVSGQIATTIAQGLLDAFAGSLSLSQAAVFGTAAAEGVAATEVLGRDAFSELTDSLQTGGSGAAIGNRLSIEQSSLRSGGIGFNPLVVFGATQAIFFALFTANGNATSILEEERDGTFTRLLASPSSRPTLLAAKLGSTFVMVLFQLALLFIAFTLMGSLLEGQFVFIWGDRFLLILLVLLSTAAATSAIGGVVAASAKSPEQSGVVGTVITMYMAVTGGSFGFRLQHPIRLTSAVHWGADAFEELAAGGTDIWMNVIAMTLFAAIFGGLAFFLFVRRFTR